MQGITGWHYRPYTRLTETQRAQRPYICRIAPGAGCFSLEWFDHGDAGPHVVSIRASQSPEPEVTLPLTEREMTIGGLEDGQDYELCVRRARAEGQSDRRLVRTGAVPGTVVNYLHPQDPLYAFSGHSLCSPSLVRLPSGKLLAAMDVFAGGGGQNLTLLMASEDEGAHWRYVADIFPSFWPKLFWHRGALYLLANATEYGDLMIGRSEDEGETWTPPVRLVAGGGMADMGPHKAPMPVIEHQGRLYTGLDYGAWKFGGHANGLLSVAADADLLHAANWRHTPFLPYDPAWPNAPQGPCPGCIEGNALVTPDGQIANMLRIDQAGAQPAYGSAVILRGDAADPEAPLQLDRIVSFPLGASSKFQVYQDPVTGKYLAVGNEVVNPATPRQRNVLSLAASDDLYHWRVATRIVDQREADPQQVAFQYPDFVFCGDDLLVLSRTALNGAHNFHDANYSTLHRVSNYRQYL